MTGMTNKTEPKSIDQGSKEFHLAYASVVHDSQSSNLTEEKTFTTRLDYAYKTTNHCETPGNSTAENPLRSFRAEKKSTDEADQQAEDPPTTNPSDGGWKKTNKERLRVNVSGFEANESPNYSGSNSEVRPSGGKEIISNQKTKVEKMSKILLQRVN